MGDLIPFPGQCRCHGDGATWCDVSECPVHTIDDSPLAVAVQETFDAGRAHAVERAVANGCRCSVSNGRILNVEPGCPVHGSTAANTGSLVVRRATPGNPIDDSHAA